MEVSQTREISEFCKGTSDNLSEVGQLRHCRISGSSFCVLAIMEKSIPFVTASSSEREIQSATMLSEPFTCRISLVKCKI